MLDDEERTVLLAALRSWASGAPDEPTIGFLADTDLLTPTELVDAVSNQTASGVAFLEIMEHGVRRDGMTSVVNKFQRNEETNGGTLLFD